MDAKTLQSPEIYVDRFNTRLLDNLEKTFYLKTQQLLMFEELVNTFKWFIPSHFSASPSFAETWLGQV